MAAERKTQLLLVDDDLRLRTLLETYLVRDGFEVHGVGNSQQMDQALRQWPIDLIVLDITLPGSSGLDICRNLRGSGNSLPIVMLTAKGDDIDRILGLELGADDYLPKPCNPRELVARIRAVLRRRVAPAPGARRALSASCGDFIRALSPAQRNQDSAVRADPGGAHDRRVCSTACPGYASGRNPVARTAAGAGARPHARSVRAQYRRADIAPSPLDRGRPFQAALSADGLGCRLRIRAGRSVVIPRAPRSLFSRTALLIAGTLVAFSLIVWQAVMWSVVVPTADLTAEVLVARASDALNSLRAGHLLPEGATLSAGMPSDDMPRLPFLAYSIYLRRVRLTVQTRLHATRVVVTRARVPAELWIQTAATGDEWLVLSARLARPQAPLAVALVLIITALLVLGVSAWSARRLTKPLARLAADAAKIAEAKPVDVDVASGPSEVRALAVAFQSMSRRLIELNQQREMMLAGISHDLRSPLARLRVAVELIDDRDAELMRQMTVEIEEMDRMIGQFLHYVRSGYRESPVKTVLDRIVRDALAPLAGDGRIQYQYSAPQDCYLSVELVRHIALNLVQNALEHGVSPVRVTTSAGSDSVQLVVQDAGPGISATDWNEALRPFSRLRAKPGGGHAGLGLALVERLARAGHGTLTARQTESGFQVSVTLPTGMASAATGSEREPLAG